MKTILKATTAVLTLTLAGSAFSEDVYANSFGTTDLTLIDSTTGVGGSAANLGIAGWNSMETIGAAFYGYRFLGGASGLYTWTLGAPTATLVGGFEDIRGLAYDGATMWGIRQQSAGDELVTINVATGDATLVGNTGFGSVQALAVSATTLYAWDISAGLLTVDSGSGIATDVNPNNPGTTDIQGMDFGVGGTLFGARTGFYTIDTGTGAFSAVGPGGFIDLRGLAAGVVPEPATVVTVLLGGAFILLRRRAR